jgi:hypothetical protein
MSKMALGTCPESGLAPFYFPRTFPLQVPPPADNNTLSSLRSPLSLFLNSDIRRGYCDFEVLCRGL